METATTPRTPRNSASETPIIAQPQNSQSASATQAAADTSGTNSGRAGAGAISKSDAVAIDMGSFPAMDEGEVTGLGVWRRRVALRQGDSGSAWAWRFQPPAIPEQPPWQSWWPKSN